MGDRRSEPPGNYDRKDIGFLSNANPDPLKIIKHIMFDHHWPTFSVFGIPSTKEKVVRVGPPLTKPLFD